ncbi:MAG TPA: PAS domain S-box protein, partial [Candidatus Methylacidiphilales bacterium]
MSARELALLAALIAVVTVFMGWFFRRRRRQRQAEAALAKSEESFRFMVESIQDYAIIMLSPSGRITSWNTGAERLTRYRADEIIGQHFSRFYGKKDLESDKPEMELEITAREGRFEEEGWRVRKDGSQFWASVIITALREESGALRGYAKVTRDLTERRRAEKELHWKTALLEAQVNSSIDGIMVVDSQQQKIVQNQRVNDLWKIPREIADDPDAGPQLKWVMNMTRHPALFLESVLHLKSHPEEISRSELELKDGTVLDRYSAPV